MESKIPDQLHLGCGLTAPPGWLNVDGSMQVVIARRPWLKRLLVALRVLPHGQAVIPWSPAVVRMNLSVPLPFADGQFSAVYSSHLLEHLYADHAARLLRECHRVLRPGGICRAVVPDLEALVTRYNQRKSEEDPDAAPRFMSEMMVHDRKPATGLLGAYYRLTSFHQHKWMYDAASLESLFKAAGFSSVRRAGYLDSRIACIAEVEHASRIVNGEGIAVEGLKD